VSRDLYLIFTAKGLRTFVFGLMSVLLPLYLAALGYPVLYVTLGVFLIVLGNVTLNLFLASYEARMGRRGFLVSTAFSWPPPGRPLSSRGAFTS